MPQTQQFQDFTNMFNGTQDFGVPRDEFDPTNPPDPGTIPQPNLTLTDGVSIQ